MSYSVLNPIDETKITRLGFKAEPCNYIYSTPKGEQKIGVMYETDNAVYSSLKNILTGNETHSITKDDKVFILPGHPLTSDRIRSYLKKVGANVTKNVNIATIIAGTDDFATSINSRSQAKFQYMMMKWTDGKMLNNVNEDSMEQTYGWFHTLDLSMRDKPIYISPDVCRNITDVNVQFAGRELTFLTPLALDVIYNVLSRNLKVVTADVISDEANSELKFTDENTFISITNMLSSNDGSNRKMGLSLLFHCDLRGDIRYNVWKLADEYSNQVRFADRSKNRDHFIERTDFYKYTRMTKHDFLKHAFEKKFLSQKIIDDLMPQIQNESMEAMESEMNEDFYTASILENGDVMLRLKEQWKEPALKKEEDELIELQESSKDN